jgi:profilin
MSWQQYVDTNLVGSKSVTQAAIFGHDGSKWAASAGFNVTADEAKKLVAGFKDANGIRASGIFLAGTKYLTLKADDRSIYGKKGATGCVCVKTAKAVLIGVYAENIQPGSAANVVEKVSPVFNCKYCPISQS